MKELMNIFFYNVWYGTFCGENTYIRVIYQSHIIYHRLYSSENLIKIM